LVTQIHYTLTHFAEPTERFSHDAINRYLRGDRIPPRLVWDKVRDHVVPTPQGYSVFADTVLDKHYSSAIDLVRRQYSGHAKAVIKGIGVVTGGYVNPELDQLWVIDYRMYDPAGDGHSQLEHVRKMLSNGVYQQALPFQAVLMDTGYATKAVLLFMESLQQHYYCPLKDNRHVAAAGGQQPYQRVDALTWNATELAQGQQIKSKGFPKDHKVPLFRAAVSTHRTDWIVTNDPTQASTAATQQACGYRGKIEQLHREGKQITGLERCQCRKARSHRNHIGCALLVWVRLKDLATATGRTGYQLKHGLLDDYLTQQLRNPSLKMVLA
jgi:hypothetical protein